MKAAARIAFPTRLAWRGRSLGAGAAAFGLVAASTLAAEFGFVLRRFRIFGGPIPRSDSLDRPGEVALFLSALVVAHLVLIFLAYRLIDRLHGRERGGARAVFDFLFFTLAIAAVVLAVKAKLFSYFSDAMDLHLIRALGGGSLVQALVYVRDEALLMAAFLIPLGILYFILRRIFDFAPGPGPKARPLRRNIHFYTATILLLPLMLILVLAGRTADTRKALERFNAPWLFYAGLNQVADFDRDGYSFFSGPPDAFPFDPARYPFALDIPNNGIDEDGFGGDFRYAGNPAPEPVPTFAKQRKHVVLIVLESTRADAVDKRWRGRLVAPHLTALAASGTAAPEAYSHFGITAEAMKSIFSGRVAPAAASPSLFRDFKSAGYRVGVFSSQSEDFGGIAAGAAMRENSDIFVDAKTLSRGRGWSAGNDVSLLADGDTLLDEMDRRLGTPDRWRQPTFLYFNFQPPHFPYFRPGIRNLLPGRPIPRNRISLANRHWVARTYWNAVADADRLVGGVIARLKAVGAYEDSVVVVVGDHGEELFENGYLGHGHVLNPLQTQVPMLFSTPGIAIPQPAGLADVRAVLLEAAGADFPRARTGTPVFQFIGSLERPSVIGMVEAGGALTILDLQTERLRSGAAQEEGRYRDLRAGSALKAKGDRLVALWARYRWEHRLAAGQFSGG